MKLADNQPKPNKPLGVLLGLLKGVLAIALLWIGQNSLLIGWAYHAEKGAWLPKTAGVVLMLIGLPLLVNSLGQISRNIRSNEDEDDIGF
jgi:ABC-type nickel/cobalt efflux system permease component RcnA